MFRTKEGHGKVDVVLSWLPNWLARQTTKLQFMDIYVIRNADLFQGLGQAIEVSGSHLPSQYRT